MDPDSDPDADLDPTILVIDLQDANKKLILKSFSAYYILKVHLHHFSKIQSPKEVTKQYESRFFLHFFPLMIEGSGSGSVSIPLIGGSGSGRPKNVWIRNSVSRN